MTDACWLDLDDALARAADGAGRPTRFWLRDDDAVAVTPALERLAQACGDAAMPVLLAVIPAGAGADLAAWLARHPGVTPCQHGWRHANHARAGERACELGGDRPDEAVLGDLARGRDRLRALLGRDPAPVLVPPWNRVRPSLVPRLRAGGAYAALSTFGRSPDPFALNCDLDLIDWRNARRGRSAADLCGRLRGLVGQAREDGGPIGLLTHHLAHDEAAWAFLGGFLDRMRGRPDAVFVSGLDEVSRVPPTGDGRPRE